MSKKTVKIFFLAFGIVTWVYLFLSNWYSRTVTGSPFDTNAYDVSSILTLPNGKRTALLVRDYAFDMNFELFFVDRSFDKTSGDFNDAPWISRDYNLSPSINGLEDIYWSGDSSVIAVEIEGKFVYAYDFIHEKECKYDEEIKSLLEARNNLQ